MSNSGGKAAVVGVGHSNVYRRADVPLGVLAIDACKQAIEDAGLSPSDIDGVVTATYMPFEVAEAERPGVNLLTPSFMIGALGLEANWTESVVAGSAQHCVIEASHAVASGASRYALAFRGLYNPVGRRYGVSSPTTAEGRNQFRGPYGIFAPGAFAHYAQRHMSLYGGTREQMAEFASKNRDRALQWEYGYWANHGGGPLTVEDYMTSRMISYPLCIHDCDIPVQACAAFVLTNEERAQDLRNPPVYVRGTSAPVGAPKSTVMSLEEFMGCGRMIGRNLWRQAGVGPEDVSIANLYDGFSMLTPMWAEALGFCGEGEGFSWMNETSLPVNTGSGNLGSGRTHGISQMLDSVLQLMGRRGQSQVEDAELAVATGYLLDSGRGIVFGKHPR